MNRKDRKFTATFLAALFTELIFFGTSVTANVVLEEGTPQGGFAGLYGITTVAILAIGLWYAKERNKAPVSKKSPKRTAKKK